MSCRDSCGLTEAGIGSVNAAVGVEVVVGGTALTVGSGGVMQTSPTHTSTLPDSGLKTDRVKAAALGVVITITACKGQQRANRKTKRDRESEQKDRKR